MTGQTTQYCSLNTNANAAYNAAYNAAAAISTSGTTTASPGNVCVMDPYPTSTILQKKRAIARKVGSTYATDFLGLVEVALINSWQTYFESASQGGSFPPANLLTFDELVMNDATGELQKVKRFPGANKIGE